MTGPIGPDVNGVPVANGAPIDAVAILAQAPSAEPTSSADVEALARRHADAAAFYAAQLAGDSPDAARAAALLATRAVPAAAVTGYQLGYAPPGWTALTDHLRARGYTDAQLLDAGVGLRTRRGSVVDRFRDRLVFPVRDPGGQRVVGFLGRALTEGEGIPKYLNSPGSALYRKGEVLYGLGAEPTRHALAAGARPVLVEGPLDAIAVTCAAPGRYVGVAPCGTALTAAQVAALDTAAGPLAERGVLVAFDNDPAGRQAGLRAYELVRATGAWPTSATLPDGLDPAALAQQRGGRPRRRRPAGPLDQPAALGRRPRRRRPRRRRSSRHASARARRPAGTAGGRAGRPGPRRGHRRRHRRRAPGRRCGEAIGSPRPARRPNRGWVSPAPAAAVQLARAGYPQRPTGPPATAGLITEGARRSGVPPVTQHRSAGLRR
jgi:hypothetical protein